MLVLTLHISVWLFNFLASCLAILHCILSLYSFPLFLCLLFRLPTKAGEQCQVQFGQQEVRFHQVNALCGYSRIHFLNLSVNSLGIYAFADGVYARNLNTYVSFSLF